MSGDLGYSIFEYQYRDASNYKEWEAVRLRGACSEADKAVIEANLNPDGMFIPEFVGLPPLQSRMNGFPSEDDHFWHEYIELRIADAREHETCTEGGDLSALVMAFASLPNWESPEMSGRIGLLSRGEPYSLIG